MGLSLLLLVLFLMLGLLFLVAIPLGLLALVLSPDFQRSVGRMARAFAPVMAVGLGVAGLFGYSLTKPQMVQHESRQAMLQSAQHADALRSEEPEQPRLTEPQTVSHPAPPSDTSAPRESVSIETEAAPVTPADPLQPRTITAFVGESSTGQLVDTLPDWVGEDLQRDTAADQETFVLRSSRYSSVDEADAELLRQLRPPLENYLRAGGMPAELEGLTLDDVRQAHLRTRRVVEELELPLKSSVEPMYRVAWQVTLRPVVRDTLGIDYRQAAQRERLWLLGAGVGVATLLFGIWAAYFRIDDATRGQYRVWLKLVAAGTSLLPLAGLFLG